MNDLGRVIKTHSFFHRLGFVFSLGAIILAMGILFESTEAAEVSGSSKELSLLVQKVKEGEGFTGAFIQTLGAPGSPTTRSEGSLVYKAPGLMILRYTNPAGQWLRIEGSRMALYVPQNRQVLLKTIRKHRIPETPAILLASIPDISKWFFVRPENSSALRKGNKISLVLIPRHPDPHLAQARLTLKKGKGILTDLLFMEQNGTSLSIHLANFKVLPHVSPNDLKVSVPKGTTAAEIPGAF